MWRLSRGTAWPVLVHSVRTAIACVASLLVARLFRLPEAYWAPITTMVITQSSLGAALAVSWQRFVGTFLGAAVGAVVGRFFGAPAPLFGPRPFIFGMVCPPTPPDFPAYWVGGGGFGVVVFVAPAGAAGAV